ncbi:hypothetical protein GEU84_011600 [Fertoebacter nigrum]|uniref:Tetratricopeptide repeat protein n=1 Tax=Fertoeibacter niger TaxID=2656921 RepID=A0A8X8KL79_9RHOB|nr:hypothetical protein [Fertoeibacter niger]NUB45034.1 hypothetical protein [Fertoeibacter niger]
MLDDVEHIHDAAVAGALAETIQLLTRKGAKILLTGSSRPNLTMLRSCGLATNACIELGALSEAEIEQLVALLGGNPNDWGRYIHIASSGGHPQLAHALALGLAERGWPESEFRSLAALLGHDAATREVLDDTRRRIMGEIPEGARDLLYRLSLLIGVFDRQTVLALARPSPPVARPGEAFDRLLGPWIERVGNDEFRASPLIRGSAEAMLPKEEITALHAAAARDHTARKSLRADKLDPIFTYALLGREERSLTLAAFAVLSAPHADLQMLAESSTVFCHYTSLTGQFPNPTPLHAIVRSAQLLLLAASGQTEKLRTAWGLFHEELSAIPHETFSDSEVKGADSLHLYVLWKLLGLEGAIEVLTDLPDACLVFGDLMAVSPIALDDLPAASADAPIGNRAAAFFFQLQLGQAKSVAALIRTFEALKRRTEAERMTLLATLPAEFINDELAVRGPWMTLFKKGERGTESLAQEYLRLAELLDRQEEVGFMLGAVETAAIILDEDLGKGAAALAVVEGALARHPGNVRLLRALSRIHFHAHRYPEQLAIGMRLEEAVEFGAIELAHFQRELAVGLANLGQNEEAARLFERAARNAGAVALPSMANMAAGLLADAAVQHVFAGRGPAVLALLAEALPLIDTRRTNNEFDDVALRKLFGHTVVWARMELFGTKGGTGELRLSMVAGANSNSAKHQDLLTTKSGPVEVLWYMLADLEALLGVDHGIGRAIDKPNWDARALFELELSRPVTQLRAAIRNENGQLIGEALARVIDVEAALSTLDGARPIGDDFNFSRGRVPILSEVAFAAVRHNYTVYPLAVFIRMSLRGNAAEASILLQTIASASRPVFSPEQVGNIRDLSKARPIEDFLSVALSVAQSVENSSVPAIDQLFLITLRLVENDNNPIAGEVVSHAADWLERSWREALNRQSFRLKNPQLARPLVEAALATTRPPCSRFAKLLLVIEPYLSVRLSRELRDRVQANAAD